jgi:hypothetical protein
LMDIPANTALWRANNIVWADLTASYPCAMYL